MNYIVAQMDEVPAIRCSCGTTRRAFKTPDNPVATQHLLDVQEDAQVHYHRNITEIYMILEGEGYLELDGERVPVKPLTSVLIKPGCRHRAVGNLRVLLTAIPAFDPEDEWFD